MYDSTGRVAIASEHRYNVYANALETFLSNATLCKETIFRVLGM